jgi:hypothetical protein
MNPQHAALFTAIDQYVRAQHHCFVAELDLWQTEWVICIRPTEENIHARSLDVYACKFFRLLTKDAGEVCAASTLGSKLMERIDRELRSISDTAPD